MSKEVKILLVILGTLDLLAVNGAVGYLLTKKPKPSAAPQVSYIDQCGDECKKYIDAQLKSQNLKVKTETPTPTPATKIVYQTAPKTKVRSTTYVTLAGSGNTTATDWVNATGSDFYFNPADYPGLVSVYFEANMKLMTGSGRAYVRLYDVTHGIGVQGSEASTQAGVDTVVESGQVSFWAGRNLIRVQMKSLTTESTFYTSGRLRIITEN